MAKLQLHDIIDKMGETSIQKEESLLSSSTIEILTYRIQEEQYSSKIYEQFSLFLENKGLLNLAKLFDKYSTEELIHAKWAKDHLLAYGFTPTLRRINSPNEEYSYMCCEDIINLTLKHELAITKQCNDLASYALRVNDHVLYSLASKYVSEQREEIEKAVTLKDIYRLNTNDLIFDTYVGENLL